MPENGNLPDVSTFLGGAGQAQALLEFTNQRAIIVIPGMKPGR
jgi:hypothetical protein